MADERIHSGSWSSWCSALDGDDSVFFESVIRDGSKHHPGLVAETLTNAAKHADATHVTVTATTDQQRLRVVVVDNGRGGADLSGGSGLVGLSDRVDSLGGQLVVTSPPGVGTTVEARLPLTSLTDSPQQV